MIYLFDKTQTLTGVIDEHTQALSATLEMKINEASTLDFALPLDDELSEKESIDAQLEEIDKAKTNKAPVIFKIELTNDAIAKTMNGRANTKNIF